MPFPIYYMLLLSGRADNDHLCKNIVLKNKFNVKKHCRIFYEEGKKNTENGQSGKKRS